MAGAIPVAMLGVLVIAVVDGVLIISWQAHGQKSQQQLLRVLIDRAKSGIKDQESFVQQTTQQIVASLQRNAGIFGGALKYVTGQIEGAVRSAISRFQSAPAVPTARPTAQRPPQLRVTHIETKCLYDCPTGIQAQYE